MKNSRTKTLRMLFIGASILSAAGVTLYTLWVLTQRYQPGVEALVSSYGMIFLTLATAVIGIFIAIDKNSSKALRRAWLVMGLAALCNAIAEGLWLYYDVVLKIDPYPSLADVFYLLFYPLMLIGILKLPFAPLQRERRAVIGLDMSIILILGGLFLWYFILAPMPLSGANTLANIIALAYPAADLFILAGLLSLIQRDLENVSRTVLIFLSASMIFTTLADILFAALETYDIPYTLPPLNILWLASFWAMMFAAAWQKTTPAEEAVDTFTPLLRNTLVYVAPVLGLVLAFISAITLLRLDPRLYFTLLGVFVLAGLVLVRQYLVLRTNRRLYEHMQQIAITDALTGLYNRHFFNEALPREIKRTSRHGSPLSILMMDVDNFKAFNDLHGHLRGDAMLKEIAAHLKSSVRGSDLLARFGGDEFILILPETDSQQAQAISDKLQAAISAKFSHDQLGISIGKALYEQGMTPQSLLGQADQDLYHSKPTK
jgi:diguanylate cyclase (GGDEF)-like protein